MIVSAANFAITLTMANVRLFLHMAGDAQISHFSSYLKPFIYG